jgi:hypothetical protein
MTLEDVKIDIGEYYDNIMEVKRNVYRDANG